MWDLTLAPKFIQSVDNVNNQKHKMHRQTVAHKQNRICELTVEDSLVSGNISHRMDLTEDVPSSQVFAADQNLIEIVC